MPGEVDKSFVKAFVGYLKKQIENQSLSSDGLESVEVAVQCLEAAFEISTSGEDTTASSSETASGTTATNALEAIDLFDMFQSLYVEKNPESKEFAEQIKNEGNRLMKENKYYEALLQYNRAITFDPKNPVFYCNRAAAYIRLGEHEKAVADCKMALVYNPDYGKAYGRMGIAYSNLNKFADARTSYLKALELEPGNVDYQNNLRVAEERLGQQSATPQGQNFFGDSLNNPNMTALLGNIMQNPMVTNALQYLASNPEGLVDISRHVASQMTQENPDFMRHVREQIINMSGEQQDGTDGQQRANSLFTDWQSALGGQQNQGQQNNPNSNSGNGTDKTDNNKPGEQPPSS